MRHLLPFMIILITLSSAGAAVLPRAGACGSCHVDNFREWESSAHSRSILGERFRKALKEHLLRDGTDEGSFCFRCHAPELIISGDVFEATKMALNGKAPAEGVTCVACHSVESVKGGKPVYDPGDFPGYHRVKDLRSLDRAGLCTTCHSVYKQKNIVREEKSGFLMRNVSWVTELFHARRSKKSDHGFSDTIIVEKEGEGCPGVKRD
ncbi:MAG: hypothetical protein HY026_06380 [Deltaproteobacteria bacterium]|nr:hypothetical protein [Deltaproteobacteria bacterium]